MPEFGCLLEILHHLPIAGFQKRVGPKLETAILNLGGLGDSHVSDQAVAVWHLSSGAKFPSRAVKSALVVIVFEVNMIVCDPS